MKEFKILQTMAVLIAEDDAIAASFLRETLKESFGTVLIANDGKEALNLMQTTKIDVLITDLSMPYFSGMQLIEAVRKKEQTQCDKPLPIIVISGRQEPKELIDIIKHQLVDYILKPISLSQMHETLKRLCAQINTQDHYTHMIDADMMYNPLNKTLQAGEVLTRLTHLEALLLEVLLENRNRVLPKAALMEKIYTHEVDDATFRNLLMRLRRKLGKERLVNYKDLGIQLL